MSVDFATLRVGFVRSCLLVTVTVLLLLGTGLRSAAGQSVDEEEVTECENGSANGFPCENVDLLAYRSIASIGGGSNVGLNDIWGWTDPQTGTEYALVGRSDGLAFVDVSTPTDPVYVGELPTRSRHSLWRDFKVYDNHAFIVSEASEHGMQVFDLTQLRDVAPGERPMTFEETAHYDRVERAHNVVVNTDTGVAYIVGGSGAGTTCGGGLHMVDVSEPTSPTFVGCFADPSTGRSGTGYTHDAQCVVYHGPDADYEGNEVCFNSNETALNIADVTDKANAQTIANATYPQVGYTHQAWLTEDHRYLYLDDELDEAQGFVNRTRTLVFDVRDLDNPELVTTYSGETSAIDHNQYIEGSFAYQANYKSGLRILDIAAPESPAEVAFFDTYPEGNGADFEGAWSVYPYFERNFVVVSSIAEGLFVLRPNVSPILSLEGQREGKGVRLTWSISSTAQTDQIEVEHMAPEASTWVLDETVSGRTGGSVVTYETGFDDLRPGTHRFRIRHLSRNGTVHVSKPVSVRVLPTESYLATGPFPNPAREKAAFKITLRETQQLRVSLYDVMGRRLRVLYDGPVQAGVIRRFPIQTGKRASGTYFLRVQGETFQLTRKAVVAR